MTSTLAPELPSLRDDLRGEGAPVIRVALLAGSPVVRAGLEALLADRVGLVVVGAGVADGGADAVDAAFDRAADWDADVVVWVLDAAGAVEPLLRRGVEPLREGAPPPALVLLVDRGDPAPAPLADPLAALRAGVRAVLPSDVGGGALSAAVEAAAAGV
ncbi:hypothetical protein PYV61_24085, partial [Roseisolibacter sp. H3M3-2]